MWALNYIFSMTELWLIECYENNLRIQRNLGHKITPRNDEKQIANYENPSDEKRTLSTKDQSYIRAMKTSKNLSRALNIL